MGSYTIEQPVKVIQAYYGNQNAYRINGSFVRQMHNGRVISFDAGALISLALSAKIQQLIIKDEIIAHFNGT